MNRQLGARTAITGFTLVEMLVTMAVVGILMVVVGSFFASQARISTEVQTRNELNVRLRTVAEGVAQDMQMAGAKAVVDESGPRYVAGVAHDSCGDIFVSCADETIDDLALSVFYASSLRPQLEGTACRNVVFQFDRDAGVLYRADVECNDTLPAPGPGTEFASNISGFELGFVCTNDDPVVDPSDCNTEARRGVRAGTILIQGSPRSGSGDSESLELTVAMPNTRAEQ